MRAVCLWIFAVAMATSSLAHVMWAGPPTRFKKCTSGCASQCTCHAEPSSSATSPAPVQPTMRTSHLNQQLKPNRVLVIVPLDRQDRLKEQATLMRGLASSLRAKSNLEVVESPRRVCEETFPIYTGQFDERKLVALGKKYRVDTVLYCNIESIDAYCPMRLEIQFLAVSVDQSVAILSGTRHFDLANPSMLKSFFDSYGADPETDINLKNSPTRLIDFSAAHLAGDLTRMWK